MEYIMAAKKAPTIPLSKSWTQHFRTAMLHVTSLAQYATAYSRRWAADSTNARIRTKAEYDRAHQEILHLREEMHIKDARRGPPSLDSPSGWYHAFLAPPKCGTKTRWTGTPTTS